MERVDSSGQCPEVSRKMLEKAGLGALRLLLGKRTAAVGHGPRLH